ncbi:hypothetical protein [Ornithinimicrobium kibberense]|uniref:hypothetical protein n=1 Tax=Ornithinimicrobium kibberense TaxID=282060 RepID=UPI00360A7AD6
MRSGGPSWSRSTTTRPWRCSATTGGSWTAASWTAPAARACPPAACRSGSGPGRTTRPTPSTATASTSCCSPTRTEGPADRCASSPAVRRVVRSASASWCSWSCCCRTSSRCWRPASSTRWLPSCGSSPSAGR